MASTGTKGSRSVRNPLTLSTDDIVWKTTSKPQKSKKKTKPIKQLPYEERLKLARETLLSDVPKGAPKTSPHKQHVPVGETDEAVALYDARLKLMRKKIISDLPTAIETVQIQDVKNTRTNSPSLILSMEHLDNTSIYNTSTPKSEKDGTLITKNVDNSPSLETDVCSTEHPNSEKIIETNERRLPFSPGTHMQVTFTPHELPYGIIGVAGEDAVKNEGWVQKDAVERYLWLQSLAREYETKQSATYRSISHDV